MPWESLFISILQLKQKHFRRLDAPQFYTVQTIHQFLAALFTEALVGIYSLCFLP